MSQAGANGSGGAPGTVTSLTPNEGAAINGPNINVFGYPFLTTPVMWTVNNGGDFEVENRTWSTPYVVDLSTTAGSRGTFSTIQAAINQASTDGTAALGKYATILLRNATTTPYVENLVFPANKWYQIVGNMAGGENTQTSAIISGTATTGGGTRLAFQNCTLSEMTLSGGDSISFVNGLCSLVSGTGGTIVFNNSIIGGSSLGGGFFQAYNSYFSAGGPAYNFTGTTLTLDNCFGSSEHFILTSSNGRFYNCKNINYTGTSTGPFTFVNCLLRGSGGINLPSATVYFSNITCLDNSTNLVIASAPHLIATTQGNVLQSRSVSASGALNQWDYYIGVTSTATAVALTLPASGVNDGQCFTIKDESGGAGGTNAITLSDGAGGLIDNAASQSINTNFGSLTVKKSGSNYFII